ncbi:type I methionyl aminopeptidase [Candidatus Daviesbacteria bacterium]|nr:type I methionyl aminopeptidase [Candidatus Daviesbacteria bacterium]
MSKIRNSYELKLMRESGKIAAIALKRAIDAVKVGVSELEIDEIAQRQIYKLGGDLSYKSVPGYKFATCITVNDQVVHGIPTDRKFVEGDFISVDLAVNFKGWHTDCAWSKLLGQDAEKERFLEAGERALWKGIEQAVDGNRIGDISFAIQSTVEGAGYSVVRSLVGHGVGQNLHEEPEIPGYGKKGTGSILKSGMTLAIEVIYTKSSSDVILDKDGWTYNSADASWGAVYEMSVVVGREKAEVLTSIQSYGL